MGEGATRAPPCPASSSSTPPMPMRKPTATTSWRTDRTPNTLEDVTGIFDIWDESKIYHLCVKGRGTRHFALSTLIDAQCRLFDVLYAGSGADVSAFYVAVGGTGVGQPPTALTEGTGARRKNLARDAKHLPATDGGNGARRDGRRSGRRLPKVDLTNLGNTDDERMQGNKIILPQIEGKH